MFTYFLSFSSPFHFYINTFSFLLFPVQMAKTMHTHRENEAMRLISVNLIIHENNMHAWTVSLQKLWLCMSFIHSTVMTHSQQMFLTLFSE